VVHSRPTLANKETTVTVQWMRYPVQEEEEGGGGGGGGYAYSVPKSLDTLSEWFQVTFSNQHSYPIYGITLLDRSNPSTIDLIANSKDSLSAIAGKEVCFAYFRDGELAEKLAPWSIDEHIKYAEHIASILGASLPSIAFFSSLEVNDGEKSPHVVLFDLKDKSPEQSLSELSRLFSNYYDNQTNLENRIARLDLAKKIIAGQGLVISSTKSAARDVAVEFFKAAGKSVWTTLIG
jgi:hypothetical protein